MGRKSSLSAEQWAEIGKRLLEGEGPSELARELTSRGLTVSESTIRSHFERKGQKTKTIQQVASQLYDAEAAQQAAQQALQILPPGAQVAALTLAQRMRNISEKLGAMADVSAGTSLLFASHANGEAQKIDDAEPSKSKKHRESAVALQKAANEAAEIPKAILVAAANRDAIKRLVDDAPVLTTDGALTPEQVSEGARRIAFVLHRAAAQENS